MITACTVTLDCVKEYYEIYKKSIVQRTKLISEVFVAKVDSPPSYSKTWEENGIKFCEFGTMGTHRTLQGLEHGLGLHDCIDRATNEYLMFHDPDVFFYMPTDEFYYNLLNKYKLNYIGVSHCSAARFAYTFFPYLSCALVKKKDLPPPDWLKGKIIAWEIKIPFDGKYLIRMEDIPEYVDQFPNPAGDFDTGAYLWLWAHQNNWKWVSFQTVDIHTYTTRYNRGNVKLQEKFGKEKLIYHATSSTTGDVVLLKDFKQAWQTSLEEQCD